jgi:NAD(P)-dependent dehydrogenase (short-subunit alcohol dehydrogenase family)
MPIALVTGASRGLGLALCRELAAQRWQLIIDARDPEVLAEAARELGPGVVAIAGDVANPEHRKTLGEAVAQLGGLDLLVNNASTLGPSPLPGLARYPIDELERVYRTNTLAPLALIQTLLPYLRIPSGIIVNITSDAAWEPYRGWGGYGSSKAALDQLTAVLGAEHPEIRIYSFDPGDMRTAMHQLAFPGEDISDRPDPEVVVPALLRLIDGADDAPPSGRYRATDLLVAAGETGR